MATNGEAELIKATRALLITDSALSNAGVYHRVAPVQAALPYVLFSFKPMPLLRTFAGTDTWWRRLQVKVCATGQSITATVEPLKNAAYTLLTVEDGGGTPQAKLSALLASDGFRALALIEQPELEPYSDVIVEGVERWHYGLNFDLRIARL